MATKPQKKEKPDKPKAEDMTTGPFKDYRKC